MSAGATQQRSLIPDRLRQVLRRYQLLTHGAVASSGVGNRRSRTKGEGIEFEDFKDYAIGDDMRRVDPHVFARLGQHVVRQYNAAGRINVVLLVDISPSMEFGDPSKADVALSLAAGLALCSLSHGDSVRCGVFTERGTEWYPTVSSAGRFEELDLWLAGSRFRPTSPVQGRGFFLPSEARPDNLVIIISDVWGGPVSQVVADLAGIGADLVLIRVLAAEERDPSGLGTGSLRLVDSESGDEVEIDLGNEAITSYLSHLESSSKGLRDLVQGRGGRFVDIDTATPLNQIFERQLREAQVIR
jgi:uncharacterized protein (DUF58 family)